eukprot:GHVS01026044.1.p1 GENE.GHVS01026044.1~~GHVS01026044.1.p1  ORF type:complete len:281 (+),score=100.31 GHVS01026044.1:67-909(+)
MENKEKREHTVQEEEGEEDEEEEDFLKEEMLYACRSGDRRHLEELISLVPLQHSHPSSASSNNSNSNSDYNNSNSNNNKIFSPPPSSGSIVDTSSSSSYLLHQCVDSNGSTGLHLAAANGHVEIVRLLLQLCPALAAAANNAGNFALHWAVQNRHTDVVKVLLGLSDQETTTTSLSCSLVNVLAVNSAGHSSLGEAFKLQPPDAELVTVLSMHPSADRLQRDNHNDSSNDSNNHESGERCGTIEKTKDNTTAAAGGSKAEENRSSSSNNRTVNERRQVVC